MSDETKDCGAYATGTFMPDSAYHTTARFTEAQLDTAVQEAVKAEREVCARLAAPRYGEYALNEQVNAERALIERNIRARSKIAREGHP